MNSVSSRLLLGVGVAAFGLAACGGSDSGGSPESVDAAGSESAAAQISILDFNFSSPITIGTGESVVVTNNDGADHTWTSDDGLFDSGTLSSGSSFEYQFAEAGEFLYHCEIHPSMTSSVTVEG